MPSNRDSSRTFPGRREKRPAPFSLAALLLLVFATLLVPASPQAVDNFQIQQPAAAQVVISPATYGLSEASDDNTQAIRDSINACFRANSPCKVALPKGKYRVGLINSIIFSGLTDFEFDGGGSTLLFSRESIVNQNTGQSPPLFYINICTRCRFSNFVVDWDWDRWILASRVTILNSTETEWTLQFNDYTSLDTSKFFDYQVLSQMDRSTQSIGTRNGREYFIQGAVSSATQTDSNILKLRMSWPISNPPKPGDLYLLRHLNYELHGFYGRTLKHTTFQDITIFAVPGKCWTIGDDTKFLLFQGIKVVRARLPAPAPSGAVFRPITSTADGIFVGKSEGYIKILDYEFSYGGDDGINIHNPTSSRGFTILSSYSFRVARSPTWRITYRPGDEVAFLYSDFSPTNFFARIISANYDSSSETWDLTINRELPARFSQLASSMIVSQSRYRASNVVIKRAYLHHHRARGMLLQSANTLVADSRFEHIHMACMSIRASAYWSEGTGVRYVKVINNTFDRCSKSGTGADKGAIRIDGEFAQAYYGATWRLHSDIEVRNNQFINVPGRLWDVSSARRVVFAGNTINVGPADLSVVPPDPSSGESYVYGQSLVSMAKDVLFSGNTYVVRDLINRPWTDPVVVDTGTTTNVVVQGTTIVQQGSRRMLLSAVKDNSGFKGGALSFES